MPGPLFDAKLLLERAKSHISDLDREVTAYFSSHPEVIRVDYESKPGRALLRVDIARPLPDWRLNVRSIAFDLWSPLDYATVAVGQRLKAIKAESNIFVVGPTEDRFERELKKRKIEVRCPPLAAFLRDIKPYKGPNDLLFGLHELHRTDKHRELAAIAGGGGWSITHRRTVVTQGGMSMFPPRWEPAENSLILMDASADTEIDADIEIGLNVTFGKLDGFNGEPVVAVLTQMANAVEHVISQFEVRFFS